MTRSNVDIYGLISQFQAHEKFKDLNWKGSFGDYINSVKEHPEITRTAFQRVYDMIVGYGTSEYTEFKKKILHYQFFDDEVNGGKDAVYGLDISLMKLVNTFRSAAEGYGTEHRVFFLPRPLARSKPPLPPPLKP